MKIVTMYELLGLVKDNKAPKRVKYRNEVLYYDDETKNYFNDEDMHPLFDGVNNMLDEEVEILEEEKKIPEKIKIDNKDRIQALSTGNFPYKVNQPTKNIIYKVNEIIDYLKSKGDNKEELESKVIKEIPQFEGILEQLDNLCNIKSKGE